MNRKRIRTWYYATAAAALGTLAVVAALLPFSWYHA